jgi:CubicO group peptidase (beta-lactamase class C family)
MSCTTLIDRRMTCFFLLSLLCAVATRAYDFGRVVSILNRGVSDGVFPGWSVAVTAPSRTLYARAGGNFTYASDAAPVKLSTMFDMASCTKVVATTSAVARLHQRGLLSLDAPVAAYLGAAFGAHGKGAITVRNCLLHNAGFKPDPVPFWNVPSFGCAESGRAHPQLSFSCMPRVLASVLNQTLDHAPGAVYVYSDLSFVTLMFVVGQVVRQNRLVASGRLLPQCDLSDDANALQCYYEAFVRTDVLVGLGLGGGSSGFLPPASLAPTCAPTMNDTVYRHAVVQGQVQDQNAYAMGGVAGHAGLFANAKDMVVVMQQLLGAGATAYLNATTVQLFTREHNQTQSSRALGWNTNDPAAFDAGWNCSCGTLSPRSFMHLGYTGTMLCGDPDRQIGLVLLTNRVWPDDARNSQIGAVRRAVGRAVQLALDAVDGPRPMAQCH